MARLPCWHRRTPTGRSLLALLLSLGLAPAAARAAVQVFVNDQPGKENETPFASLDATFLVASPTGIFLVSSNMSVSEFRQFYAIGSGGDYAIGAVHALYNEVNDPADLAQRGVRAAIAYDSCCGGEIEQRTVKIKSTRK